MEPLWPLWGPSGLSRDPFWLPGRALRPGTLTPTQSAGSSGSIWDSFEVRWAPLGAPVAPLGPVWDSLGILFGLLGNSLDPALEHHFSKPNPKVKCRATKAPEDPPKDSPCASQEAPEGPQGYPRAPPKGPALEHHSSSRIPGSSAGQQRLPRTPPRTPQVLPRRPHRCPQSYPRAPQRARHLHIIFQAESQGRVPGNKGPQEPPQKASKRPPGETGITHFVIFSI